MEKNGMAQAVTAAYQKVENTVVSGYQKVQSAVVDNYTKIEDAFVKRYLVQEGETLEDAKQRLKQNTK